jgi:tetratricopeptide (TPR) repeat protein
MIVPNMRVLLFFTCLALFGQQPPDIDALLKSAHAAYRKADYPGARKSLEEAWAGAGELAPNDPKRYEILKQLADVTGSAGDNDAALNYIELAINWRETAVSADVNKEDPLIADDLVQLSTICERRKDFDRAIAVLRRVITLHTKAHGNFENSDVADDFSRIALVQADQNPHEPEAAIPTLIMAIGIREKVLGADSPGLLSELDRLGTLQIATRFYEGAEVTFRRALSIRERVLGSRSPDLLTTLEGLAYSLFGEKKYDDAEIYYKRLLELWQLIGNLPMIAETQEKIAVFYREQQKWDQGTEAATNAMTLRAKVAAIGLSTEATAWIAHGDKAHAIELYRKALTLLEEGDGLRGQIEHVLADLDPPKPAAKKKQTTSK